MLIAFSQTCYKKTRFLSIIIALVAGLICLAFSIHFLLAEKQSTQRFPQGVASMLEDEAADFYFLSERLTPRDGFKYKLMNRTDSSSLSYETFARLLSESHPQLLAILTVQLVQHPSPAYLMECIPVTFASFQRTPFEFVLLPSQSLAEATSDPTPFREYVLHKGSQSTAVFSNLEKDGLLIAPCPLASYPHSNYTHIAAFMRSAGKNQIVSLWSQVGKELFRRVVETPSGMWLSTNGLGVPWLNIRIDSRPKYYEWGEYKNLPQYV